MKTKPKPKKWR